MKKNTLIVFSTRWGAEFGGINSFNQDLLIAFAGVAFNNCNVICVTLNASDEQINSAAAEQVAIISLGLVQDVFPCELEANVWEALSNTLLDKDSRNFVWLGHDRITGQIAISAAAKRGGRSAVIHHMCYGSYEAFSESSGVAQLKETEQRSLFKSADLPIAIGPFLRNSLCDMLDVENISMLIPGLPEISTRRTPKTFKVFLSGRLTDDARKVKQAHLGVAAFGDSISQADANPGLPDALRGENDPKLTLRGVDFERITGGYDPEAELELKRFSERYAGRAFTLHALPFTTDRKTLFFDLAASSVAMMPSWHEGFGLVAWEAIAAGVPLIVTKKSGVYRFLRELDDGMFASLVSTVDVLGTSDEPFFLAKDCSNLADSVILIAKDPAGYRRKAARLREALAERYSWSNCARELANLLSWEISNDGANKITVPMQFRGSDSVIVAPLELPQAVWAESRGVSDSQLLRAEEAVIPFDRERIPFMQEQLDWASSVEYPIAVRLLIGAGGIGKTRLAIEMCHRLLNDGWHAGFLQSDCDIRKAEEFGRQIGKEKNRYFIVIDYAETRQSIFLALLRGVVSTSNSNNIRILLLARSGGEWWDLLGSKESSCESLLAGMATSGPFDLPILHGQGFQRQQAYQIALTAFATRLNVTPPEHEPDLEDSHFTYPLYVQMAALMALRGERPKTAEALTRSLVGHERRYWMKAFAVPSVDNVDVEHQAALLMALATLAGGFATVREAEKVWDTSGGEPRLIKALFSALLPLYPARQGLDGWRPDIVGEALIAQILLTNNGPDVLGAMLRQSDRRVRKSSLTVMARMLRYREDVAIIVEDCLVENFSVCVEELVSTIIETESTMPKIAERAFQRLTKAEQSQVAGMLEPHFRVDILPLSGLDVLVSQVILDKFSKSNGKLSIEKKVLYRAALGRLAIALDRDGQQEKAVDIAQKCIEVCHSLVSLDADRFEKLLAMSLHTYCDLLTTQGRLELAFSISAQVLKIRERQVLRDGEIFESELASLLAQQSKILLKQGKFDEALSVANQAITISKKIAEKTKNKISHELGFAYGNYASALSVMGKIDDAFEATNHVVEIFYQLSKDAPEQHEDSLAVALNNYSTLLHDHGRLEEALVKIQQAVSINRRLTASKPQRFGHVLANSLSNYAALLSDTGQVQDALLLASEALEIRKKLAYADPLRFEDQLSQSLNNYASHLYDVGRFEEAVRIDEQNIPLLDRLWRASPQRYEADYGTLLTSYASHLGAVGRWKEAVVNQKWAIEKFENAAKKIPHRYFFMLEADRISHNLWLWLNDDRIIFNVIVDSKSSLINQRDSRVLDFQFAATKAIISKKDRDLLDAFEAWQVLDLTQQSLHQSLYVASVVIASNIQLGVSMPHGWAAHVEQMRNQMQGRFPSWIVEAVIRAGGEI